MDKKTALKIRRKAKSKKPKFKRQEGFKHKRLKDSWRKPKGRHSKLRKQERSRGKLPSSGYRSPKTLRGLNQKGLIEIRVANIKELESLDPELHGVMISANIGKRKREEMIKLAEKKGIIIIN